MQSVHSNAIVVTAGSKILDSEQTLSDQNSITLSLNSLSISSKAKQSSKCVQQWHVHLHTLANNTGRSPFFPFLSLSAPTLFPPLCVGDMTPPAEKGRVTFDLDADLSRSPIPGEICGQRALRGSSCGF